MCADKCLHFLNAEIVTKKLCISLWNVEDQTATMHLARSVQIFVFNFFLILPLRGFNPDISTTTHKPKDKV